MLDRFRKMPAASRHKPMLGGDDNFSAAFDAIASEDHSYIANKMGTQKRKLVEARAEL